ncbi:trypsin-1-like [Sitophilus oryzae]|uniref:Trypsin-1-like n=1 Tax=Sitophilus oryzae TaxID=7048 RepID=A0A6J2XP42_SITOR|nr:trypsin-1-like [Sitophilus oryzae]
MLICRLFLVQFYIFYNTIHTVMFVTQAQSVVNGLTRIVGGQKVDISSYPYQLSMQYGGRHICGASIIGTKIALTAAHCTVSLSASRIRLRAGSTSRTSGGQMVQVAKVHQHPKFNYATVDYDISILEVNPAFMYSANIKNVPISTIEPKEGTKVITSGWGTLRESSHTLPTELQSVEIPVIERSKCQQLYRRRGIVTIRMICAGAAQGGKDSCQGDSGGPLVSGGKLVGIVSWGFGCGRVRYPGVYTNLNNREIRSYIKRIAKI